ncbi:MAG TPA: hypothetical protein PKM20_10755 [Nitrosomonas sp.]|nr:hypothetical protein [Nitrosomonas sp.]
MTIGRVWRDAMQGERMSHSTSYGDDEQRRSVPARCDPNVTVIYERLLIPGIAKTYWISIFDLKAIFAQQAAI